MKIDIEDPIKLAKWLAPALAQHKRQAKDFAERFGADSQGHIELINESMRIQKQINDLVQAKADAPLKPR